MNNYSYKENIDINTLRLLYGRYKEFIIPFFVIFISLALAIKVIVPQVQNLIKVKEEQKAALHKLSVMRNNFNLLASISDSSLDSQLQIVSTALPINKDAGSILNALNDASNKAGVFIEGLDLQPGELLKVVDKDKYPSLKVNLTINNGDVEKINNFIDNLNKTLPLSEVTSIMLHNKLSDITAVFYYKHFLPLQYNDNLPLSPVSTEGLSLINKISAFNNPNISSFAITSSPESTPSGNTNPFF